MREYSERATYNFISANNTSTTMYIHDEKEHTPQEAAQHFKRAIYGDEYYFRSGTAQAFIRENPDCVLISKHDDYDDTVYKYDVVNREVRGRYTSEIIAWKLQQYEEIKFYPIFEGSVEEFIREYE